jgi:hypothetical protein
MKLGGIFVVGDRFRLELAGETAAQIQAAASAAGSSAACTTTNEVTARVRQTYSRRSPVT